MGDRAYMILSGATDEGRSDGVLFLVMFEALQVLRASGFRRINLGGAGPDAASRDSPDHGLHQFETRFGAEPIECTSGTLAVRPMRAAVVHGVRRLLNR